ncbi:hypothetical protein [Allorhodopirellula solitaria]|uniref:hypothetical protein n=1 Tax=Allorhodopirellula solitaria TaxID=2527987 RepID=UPI0011B6BBD0|nr:hypothetical protein [Allorhodopirellula solitaria]
MTGDGELLAAPRFDHLIRQTLGIQNTNLPVYRFRKDDDFWWVAFGGTPRPVKDSSGMPYIASLLSRPSVGMTAMQLESVVSGIHEAVRTGGRGKKVDDQSLRESHSRLKQIASGLDAAKDDQDFSAMTRLETERDEILAQVRKDTGLSGAIHDDSDAKRAGDSVARAIRRAIKEIEKKVPELADHLRSDVTVGIDCMYSPKQPVDWEF